MNAMARRLGVIAAALTLGLLGCAGSPGTSSREASVPANPLLWRAAPSRAGHGTLYLLGSVHMGTAGTRNLGPTVAKAFERVDEIVVEIDTTRVTAQQAMNLTQRYGVMPAGRSAADVLSRPTLELLRAYFESRDLPAGPMLRFKPWLLSLTIVQLELQEAGYQAELGVDSAVMGDADGRKPIVSLETMDSQLIMLDEMPAHVQELMLKDTLVRTDEISDEVGDLMDAWRRGDEEAVEQLVFRPLREHPELEVFYDRVFYERNETMTADLMTLSRDGRSRLVVLGAGHMVGERGIPALLAQRGFQVGRVRAPADL